ncbi:bZIP transcription factor [Halorussus halophilus]|uniref:bZIP transcription factor n=1 Tax=Halorussus halophilus TaxID=2650975 RepID=UPI0013010A9A|nr:bZIP transcription factor [Halorussus halophilus]
METRTVEQVEGWDSRSFSGGYDGLRQLSDREFSGAINARGAWLFMLNGRIIGIYEGSLESFEDASGTAYSAPHPSLPLLFSMREKGGETQAKYYTNDTALSEADSTLKSGNFTGFIELSENVLSGDYYVAYYGGRSMSVAFVGASEQVVTGDDAFQRANDEVGIYEVRNVDLDVIDVPESETDEEPAASGSAGAGAATGAGATGAAAGAAGAGQATGSSGASESNKSTATESTTEATGDYESFDPSGGKTADSDPSPEAGSTAGSSDAHEQTGESNAQSTDSATETAEQSRTERSERTAAESDAASQASTNQSGSQSASQSASESPAQSSEASASTPASKASDPETPAEPNTEASSSEKAAAASSGAGAETDADGAAFDDEEEWRETTTIPSLNPDRSKSQSKSKAAGAGASNAASAAAGTTERATSTSSQSASGAGSSSDQSTPSEQSARSSSAQSSSRSSGSSAERQSNSTAQSAQASSTEQHSQSNERTEQLRSKLKQSQQQVEQLEQRVSTVESERDELKRERDTLRQEVERLESKLSAAQQGGGTSAGTQLTVAQAFEGTNLFVRYQSKGKATLDEAAQGNADPDDVNANLQLEHHTQFDADDVAVDGEEFDAFLTDSFEYRFASWVVENLLYEIRDTGHRGSLKDLYDAIPKVDRVDFHGSVSAGEDEDGTRQESFDVIMRDRMGNPLVAADLNASRDPTTGEMMGSLVDASTGVAEAHEELAGAFQVTASFFEPAALETAENATSGGFLSREKRESFVKLSRKRGFHLCLVESRSGGFHLNVPEL